MTKSELVPRLVKANPHLIKRDVEMIVSTFFGENNRRTSPRRPG
jgi:nucleoid DNA-binding protein